MDNIFDRLKISVFDTIANTMGYAASWRTHTARVLFKDLSEHEKLGGAEYEPNRYRIEYKQGDFPGLKEAVDGGSNREPFTIKGREFIVRSVIAIIDGDCFIADLVAK